jgi:uncharacterized membrane protein YkvA (DUF1232 family)
VTVEGDRSDPFARDRFIGLVGRFPRYARLAWRLSRDDRLSRARQAALVAAAVYLVSPIDLVPGFIPVVGQLDDGLVVLLAIRHALTGLPPAQRGAALAEAGLSMPVLEEDLETIRATYAWIGRQGARLTWRATRAIARGASRVGRRLASRLRPGP